MDSRIAQDLVQIFFLLIFTASGWIIAREDLAVGKIRNKWLARGLAACLAGYGLQTALSLAGHFGLAEYFLLRPFYLGAAANAAISLGSALALWFLAIWPAGDAKFFIVCAVFVPLINPGLRGLPYFLALELLVNIFLLSACFVLLRTLSSPSRVMEKLSPADFAARWREFLPRALNTAGLFLAQTLARPFLADIFPGWATSSVVIYILLFLLWDRLKNVISNKSLSSVSGTAVFAFISWSLLRPSFRPSLEIFLAQWLGFGVFFSAARGALEFHLIRRALRTIAVKDISPGIILSEKSLSLLKRDREYFNEHFTPLFGDGLSSSQAQALRNWLMGFPEERQFIEVLKAAPFGVWIFVGTLFTLAARRDAVSLALSWFH